MKNILLFVTIIIIILIFIIPIILCTFTTLIETIIGIIADTVDVDTITYSKEISKYIKKFEDKMKVYK